MTTPIARIQTGSQSQKPLSMSTSSSSSSPNPTTRPIPSLQYPLTSQIIQPHYTDYQGNSKFFCGGRFVLGSQPFKVAQSAFLIVLPLVLYFPFVAVDINKVSGPWAFIVTAILTLLCLFTLCVASFTNPGILPRANLRWTLDIHDHDIPSTATSTANTNAAHYPNHVKYCYTCKIFRPLRSVHCSVCDNCVFHLDHHCPWLGTCVGGGNYHYFLYFLYSLLLNVLVSVAINIYSLIAVPKHRFNSVVINGGKWATLTQAFQAYVSTRPYAFIVIAYALFALCMIGYLWGFHIRLGIKSITTIEHIKHTYGEKHGQNPFSRSVFRNLLALLFPTNKRSPGQDASIVVDQVKCIRFQFEQDGDEEQEKAAIEAAQAALMMQDAGKKRISISNSGSNGNNNAENDQDGGIDTYSDDSSTENDQIPYHPSSRSKFGPDIKSSTNNGANQSGSKDIQLNVIKENETKDGGDDNNIKNQKSTWVSPNIKTLFPQTVHIAGSKRADGYVNQWSRYHITKYLQERYDNPKTGEKLPQAPQSPDALGEIVSKNVKNERFNADINGDVITTWIEEEPMMKGVSLFSSPKTVVYSGPDADLIMRGVSFVNEWE
jgi:hypothetical protein